MTGHLTRILVAGILAATLAGSMATPSQATTLPVTSVQEVGGAAPTEPLYWRRYGWRGYGWGWRRAHYGWGWRRPYYRWGWYRPYRAYYGYYRPYRRVVYWPGYYRPFYRRVYWRPAYYRPFYYRPAYYRPVSYRPWLYRRAFWW